MIAPSEKHLEDWIVQNGMPEIAPQCEFYHQLIARQLPLPDGVADLVYLSGSKMRIEVVELKKGALDESAIAQVLRYKANIDALWQGYIECRPSCFNTSYEHSAYELTTATLVGHSISPVLLEVCTAAKINVWLYDYTPDDNLFEFESEYGDWCKFGAYVTPKLRDALKQVFLQLCVKNDIPTTGDFKNIDGDDL